MAPERWAPIPWPDNLPAGETPPYEASSHGNIRSVLRTLIDGRTCGGTLLTLGNHNRGYRQVKLRHNGVQKTFLAHKLVLLAFEGDPPPGKPYTRHLDDDPTHNYWAPGGMGGGGNLVYGTEAENIADRMRREAAAAHRPIVVVEEETNAAIPTLRTVRVNPEVREAIEATIRKASQPVTHTPSPRRRWLARLGRYTPWSRRRRATRKADK